MVDFVTAIFNAISDVVTGAIGVFADLFSNDGIISVFWTPGVDPDPGSLTLIGILALIAFGFALVRWGFGFVLKMLRMKR